MSFPFAALSTPRLSVSLSFLAGGIGVGGWAASLPAVTEHFALNERLTGIVLLCFALGAILAMVNVGRLVPVFGASALCLVAASLFGCMLIAVSFVPNAWMLAAAIAVAGAGFGTLDVAMNTEASELERQRARPIMSSFHALFSLGNLVGAGVCGQILRSGAGYEICLVASGAVVIAVAVVARLRSGAGRMRREAAGPARRPIRLDAQQNRLLLIFGGFAFIAFMAEGAIMDWTALYLVQATGAPESTAAFAFGVFAGSMAVGRLLGDVANRRFGAMRLQQAGAACVALAFAAVLADLGTAATFVALGFCGLGIANVAPVIFSTAGRVGGAAAGIAMARVTTFGYSGLLVGPAFIGFLAHLSTLALSLCTVIVGMGIIALGAVFLGDGKSADGIAVKSDAA